LLLVAVERRALPRGGVVLMANNNLPNDFTGCETYRGITIAVRGGWYHAFREGKRLGYSASDRASLRRELDGAFPLSL
jgi:hypothetical protein